MLVLAENDYGNLHTLWFTLHQFIYRIHRFRIHLIITNNYRYYVIKKEFNLFFQQFLNTLKMDYSDQEENSRQNVSTASNKKQDEQLDNEIQEVQLAEMPSRGRKNVDIDPSQIIKGLNIKKKLTQSQIEEIMYLIFYILNFPSLEQAQSHAFANRLGSLDIKKQGSTSEVREYCKCCGYVKQNQKIPLCTSFNNFPSVGISTYLFFETIKSLILLLVLTLIVHDIFSLISNLYIACAISQQNPTFTVSNLIDWLSLNSKVKISNTDNQSKINNLYLIQMWLGTALVVLWSLLLYLIKYYERKYEVMVDKQTVSAADFSIIIQNYPRSLTKENLQAQLNEYAIQLQCQNPNIFTIQEICLNTDSTLEKLEEEQMQQINEKYTEVMDMFADWLCYFQQSGQLPYDQQKRSSIYKKFQKIKNQRLVQGKRIYTTLYKRKNVKQSELLIQKPNEKPGKTIAVVTFKQSQSKHIISRHNSMDLAKTIRYFIRCCPKKTRFNLKDENGVERDITIERAPEPEDIKWENLSYSVSEKIIRKGCTYFVTLLLLSMSFSIVYFLSSYERKNKDNDYLNFIVSFIISLVNFIIGFLIRFLTVFQKDYTQTGYQTSLAVKSIWAQLLNSIAVPIVVNYIIEQKNLFGSSGLSTDIVYLSITNSFLPPLTRLIDPYHKYIVLKALYYRKSLKQRLLMKQGQLNQSQELMQFEAGYEYIYFINLYLFTAYFVTLQPCISIFAILGMFFMYWIEKYSLLNRMKRPVPGTDLVNNAMIQLVNLGPLFYSLGALCWSHILDGYKVPEGNSIYYVPNIITAGLSALFFIFPFNVIFDKYLPKLQIENLEYQQCRILLNSQYKRTNPATMQEAIKQYEIYLQNYIKNQQFQDDKQFTRDQIRKKSQNKKNANLQNSETDQKQQISGLEYSKDQINKKKSERKGTFIKNVEVDEKFLNRKKQMLRQKTWLRSAAGSNVHSIFGEVIQHDLNNEDKVNQNNEQNQSNDENKKLKNLKINEKQQVPVILKQNKTRNKMTKGSIFKQQNATFRQQRIQSKSHAQKSTSKIMKQIKNTMANSNRQGLTKNSSISKQIQSKPRKIVDVDYFSKFLPLSKDGDSPQIQRDNNYLNFFAQNLLLKNQDETNNKKKSKRLNNPYEYSFR